LNQGNTATSARFLSGLYVDGKLRQSWYTDPPLDPGSYAYVTDYSLGPLSAGQHSIQIKADTGKTVAEISESDNVYSKTVTVTAVLPNLAPYRPSGWSDAIVVSTVTGTNTDASSLTTNNYLYVDWAAINSGIAAVSAAFSTQLYVDGALRQTWNTPAPLAAGSYAYATYYSLGQLGAGQHTIQIKIDSGRTVAESNENDNVYTKTINVASAPSYVRFAADYRDGAGEGFNDPTLGAQRRAAFEYALGIWSSLLPSAYTGETITVEAYFDPLGGTPTGAVLAQAGPKSVRWNFGGRGLSNTVYGDALANHLRGADLGQGQDEIVATFNSDVDGSYVLGSIGFYYGTDGNSGSNIRPPDIALLGYDRLAGLYSQAET
jgi:hypothetical protein